MTLAPSLEIEVLQTLHNDSSDILSCAFSGNLLATCAADKLVRLWSIEHSGCSPSPACVECFTELPQSPLCAHSYAVNYCEFNPVGSLLVTCSQDGRIIVWDVRNGRSIYELSHPSRCSVRICRFSPDGRILCSGCDDETIVFWDLSSREIIRQLEGHDASVVALDFSPDGRLVVSGSPLGDLRIWDARFGQGRHMYHLPEAHDLGTTCVKFSPAYPCSNESVPINATYILASGGNDNIVHIWRLYAGDSDALLTTYAKLEGHSLNVMCLAYTSNGRLLASGAGDKTVIIWDAMQGTILRRLDHHQRYVTCCAFSTDASLLATGSNDKTVAIWKITDLTQKDLISLENFNDENIKCGVGVADSKKVINSCGVDLSSRHRQLHGQCESIVYAQLRKPVSNWSVDDVSQWLSMIQMQQYKEKFKENAIDGQELLHLNETMLRNALAVDALGHRNRILRAVNQLRDTPHYPLYGMAPTSINNAAAQKVMAPPRRSDLDYPDEYYCPITHELMTDPVIAADGYTYERSAISAWLSSAKRTSPMTNAPLKHNDVTPNRMLKMLIQRSTPSKKLNAA